MKVGPGNLETNDDVKGGCMEIVIQNDAHREFIEEQGDFGVASSLGLKYCGICATVDILSLVSDESSIRRFHAYAGTTRCCDLPVCQACLEEAGPEPEDWLESETGILGCGEGGCIRAGEELMEARALKRAPLFYGYEAYPTDQGRSVTIEQDVRWGDALRPAGDIWAFTTEEERDAWVEQRSTLIRNEFGHVVQYRCRSAIPTETGRRKYMPDDGGEDAW